MSDQPSEGSSQILDALFTALEQELGREAFTPDLACIDDLLIQIHQTPVQDEKEKLRKKDQTLVNTIARLQRLVNRAGWMPQGTAGAFRGVIAALKQIENILWELKGEKGPPPKPQSPPQRNP